MSSSLLPWDNRRIDGEEAQRLMKEKVLELTLPPNRKTKKEIAELINRSISKVYSIQKELVEEGKLEKSESGHIIKSQNERMVKTYEDISKTEFAQIPSVKRWVDSMKRSKIKYLSFYTVNFWKICKTLDVHPNAFLQEIYEVEPLVDKFVKTFREGKTFYIKDVKKARDPVKLSQSNPAHYIGAVRSFIKRNGKQIPDGSLVVETNNSNVYANIRLSDRERILGVKFFERISKSLVTMFVLQHELGLRMDTLFHCKPMFERQVTKIEGLDCEYYKCHIFEKKQNRQYEKLVITPQARSIVKQLKNGEKIHNYTNTRKGKEEYNQKLREFYAYLGRISPNPIHHEQYEQNSEQYYLVTNPSHTIRHSCVHWLMRITGERAETVANLFWEKPDTLKVYAKQSLDSILMQGVCDLCNPPDERDQNYRRFCTIRHALLYYNLDKDRREELQIKRFKVNTNKQE